MQIKNWWNKVANFFEYGDLTPLAVIVSVSHYGQVLVSHGENVVVAWVVGTLIDLLHFRSVRRFFDSYGILSGLVAVTTTVMAMGYHLRFYGNDILLALPIPIGIAILAQHAAAHRQKEERDWQAEINGARELAERGKALANEWQEKAKVWQAQATNWQEKAETAEQLAKDNEGLANGWQTKATALEAKVSEYATKAKAFDSMNKRSQAAAMVNANIIVKEKGIELAGVSRRTLEGDMHKLNGIMKETVIN